MSERRAAPLTKRALAGLLDRAGVLRADLAARGRQRVTAVNYHGTPERLARRLERHFAFYRERFECLGEGALLAFLGGALRLRRPGLVLCFDDGLASQARVAAPLLEAAGLRGWFMVPGGFVDEPPGSQAAYFRRHIDPAADRDARAELAAMTWSEARALAARGHVIGCHAWSHRLLGADASGEVVREEVTRARERLEERLDRSVRTFCWPRGRVGDYSPAAHRAVASAFSLAFTAMSRAIRPGDPPLCLHRFHVDASFSLRVVRFQISRLNEAWFARRRREVERLLRTPAA